MSSGAGNMSVGQWSFCELYVYSNYSGSRGSKAMKMIGSARLNWLVILLGFLVKLFREPSSSMISSRSASIIVKIMFQMILGQLFLVNYSPQVD